jgi:hypothetical protein
MENFGEVYEPEYLTNPNAVVKTMQTFTLTAIARGMCSAGESISSEDDLE